MSFNYKCLSLLIGSVLSLPCAYGVSTLPIMHRQTQKNVLTTSDEHTDSNTDTTPFIQTIKLPMRMPWLTKPYERALALYNLSLHNDFSQNSPILKEGHSHTEDKRIKERKINVTKENAKLSEETKVASFPKTIKPLDWSAIPKVFLADFTQANFTVTAQFADSPLGDFSVRLLSNHYLKIDLEKVFHQLKLKPEVKHYLAKHFTKGMLINQILYCTPMLSSLADCKVGQPAFLANLDLDTLRLSFYVDQSLFAHQQSQGIDYLPDPYRRYLSSMFQYNLNVSQNFGDEKYDSVASLAVKNITGFGKTHLDSAGYLSTTDNGNEGSLSQLQLIHDFKKTSLSIGYNNAGSIFSSNALNLTYGYSSGTLGVAWYSTTNMIENKGSSSINPLIIFLDQKATVRVYRNSQLLTVQSYGIGSHEIDTSSFPSGVYQVEIKVYQGSDLIRTIIQTVNKPFDMSNLDPKSKTAFALWVGVAQNINSTAFGLPYAGASLKAVVSRYVMTNLAAYAVGALSVYEVDALVSFPWISITTSAGHDSAGGYGVNVNTNKAFTDWLSGGVYYNQTGKSNTARSPFSFDASQIGANLSLGLSNFGALGLNASYDIRQHRPNYNANYSLTLFQDYGFYITGNINATWQDQTGENVTGRSFDYSVGLTLSYNFENGSSINLNSTYHPYTRSSDNNMTFTPALDAEDTISSFDVGASYSKAADDNSDRTTTVYSDLGFNHRWLQGNLNAQAQFNPTRTQSLNGSLQGSFVANSHGLAASGDEGDSGMLLNLEGADDADMNMVINGAFYPVHSGRNYIPLSPYQPYHAYLLDGDSSDQQLVWKHFDDDFVLYPGNIYGTTRHITAVTQVLGQIMVEDKPLEYANVSNQSNVSVSDGSGFFDIEMDKTDPVLHIVDSDHHHCNYHLTAQQVATLHQGSWLGVIHCASIALAHEALRLKKQYDEHNPITLASDMLARYLDINTNTKINKELNGENHAV
ncbi:MULTISPECIES: TcfC E-set like domain-containing protein [Cysteiniphilum]|uniref:TcfC E-set like domain-containing protein n=1 Tax=Cysteiniphilum TaxID=2056696 RepID=UPI00177C891C|nr:MULTISPECIES: TcfC E-set like domain-containing protein [Cysteiniphilum]